MAKRLCYLLFYVPCKWWLSKNSKQDFHSYADGIIARLSTGLSFHFALNSRFLLVESIDHRLRLLRKSVLRRVLRYAIFSRFEILKDESVLILDLTSGYEAAKRWDMVSWRIFNGRRSRREENRWQIATDSNVVVDARGGNSHEAGGARLAVLNLSPGSDWPCTRRSLVTVLLLENWRGAEFLKPSARRVSPDGFPLLFLLSPPSLHLSLKESSIRSEIRFT